MIEFNICGENSVDTDQLASSIEFISGFLLFSELMHVRCLIKNISGYAKFLMHYLFCGTRENFFGQVSSDYLLVQGQVLTFHRSR